MSKKVTSFAFLVFLFHQIFFCSNTFAGVKLANLKPLKLDDADSFLVLDSLRIRTEKLPDADSQLRIALSIYDGSQLVARVNYDKKHPYLGDDFWYFDVDGNGLKDFVLYASYMGNGIPPDEVILLFQTKRGKFRRIDYSTYNFDIGDFRDFNSDGKYKVVISHLLRSAASLDGKEHSYWVSTIYRIEDFALRIANDLHPGFPKFNWFTEKPNHKETRKLSQAQKAEYIGTLPSVITSSAISN